MVRNLNKSRNVNKAVIQPNAHYSTIRTMISWSCKFSLWYSFYFHNGSHQQGSVLGFILYSLFSYFFMPFFSRMGMPIISLLLDLSFLIFCFFSMKTFFSYITVMVLPIKISSCCFSWLSIILLFLLFLKLLQEVNKCQDEFFWCVSQLVYPSQLKKFLIRLPVLWSDKVRDHRGLVCGSPNSEEILTILKDPTILPSKNVLVFVVVFPALA